MTGRTRRTRGVQTGPRSQRIVQSVRAATLAELARVGYAGLSIDAVASAAGVHRTTIYRRWPTKADLVASLVEPQLERLHDTPRGEDLAEDLVRLVHQLAANLAQPEGQAMAALLTVREPSLAPLVDTARDRAGGAFARAFVLARDAGTLRADADVDTATHLVFSAAIFWALDRPGGPSDAEVRRMVAVVLDGVRP